MLEVFLLQQPEQGARGIVYRTPIDDSTNRSPTELTKGDLRAYIQSVRREACQDNVSDQYVMEAVNRNTIILVMFETKTEVVESRATRRGPVMEESVESIVPIGFLIANPDKNGLYLDVICAIRNTTSLLNYFIEYCDGKTITLSSLPSVLSYYPKFQFKFRQSCYEPPVAELPESIRTRNASKKPFPKRSENAYDDEDFSDFMVDLVEKGLAVKKDGDCGKKTKVSKQDLKTGDCGSDGFTMMRCAKYLGPITRSMKKRKTRKTRKTRKEKRAN